ncbi:hypothetical protein KDA_40430 [Dictyobacter alpinus]|uniref:Uncharacterized protein n=1 Tax=Dictyobacter alpinus TaxID=2014873 RepID=A0A402BB51_9CHLR|nr:hypothetical protein [Dictyobacter alpinus]GCE28559.1 hypothetical protein KDA_40430 [Dictyobacter alpinus]
MRQSSDMAKQWNLFVRELETLLEMRGYGLNDLVSKTHLHPEKVRRLKRSLIKPHFHILNPDEIEQISEKFAFTVDEQLRIRAAILATAVEETLMNRIDPENALRAAEELFPLLVKALRQRYGRYSGLAATRGFQMTHEFIPDKDVLEPILVQFDQAMISLYLSGQSQTDQERMEQARVAQSRFRNVLTELETLCVKDPTMTQDESWNFWVEETHKNLQVIEEDILQF